MQFDAQRHPNPHNFEPERWMNGNWEFSAAEAAAQKDPTKRDHFAYGVGRRICPGIHVAETSLFLLVSRVLWMFNIGKVDEMGREIDVDVNAYAGGGLANLLRSRLGLCRGVSRMRKLCDKIGVNVRL